jgi:hypothetical protein
VTNCRTLSDPISNSSRTFGSTVSALPRLTRACHAVTQRTRMPGKAHPYVPVEGACGAGREVHGADLVAGLAVISSSSTNHEQNRKRPRYRILTVPSSRVSARTDNRSRMAGRFSSSRVASPARSLEPAAEEGDGLAVQPQSVGASFLGVEFTEKRALQILQVRSHG